jgi:predicted ATPase/class 3 adenylate cyclase/DNA-binding CsgD family transcriptional regulator
MSELDWGGVGVSELLPTGTVTLLLADVEGSTRLWETQPDEMSAAVARLDRTLAEVVVAHEGVRPVEQGEGDSFVIAFARASDAVACALDLQRAPLAPIHLRIGVHTGEVRLRDEGNYMGPTINRTARLRDLAHGGQIVLSAAAEVLVIDQLPDGACLTDLGSHPLRDLPRPERVTQLSHPDLRSEFPPLRTAKSVADKRVPPQFTSFVGRRKQLDELRQLLTEARLITLTGVGGIGKTRLAVQLAKECGDAAWYVDLAPITDADKVLVTAARALGLPDQPGRSTTDTLVGFIGDRQLLLVLDNCEHLLDAAAELIIALLGACPGLTLLTTTREPIGVPGEVVWRVPSLSLADEAVELFSDRARLVRSDFRVTADNSAAVGEICTRLDGMPLAIELAAARVRALSPAQLVESLHDRFRLLTGGARTAVRRQQTLQASVDWSHALLTELERVLFRRLGVFMGGFEFDGAQAVCGSGEVAPHQVLDQLTLLVDKSLVVVEDNRGRTRYRLLETVRQYAQEKLTESGEADEVRTRHRDYYLAVAVRLDTSASERTELLEQSETEIDNLRTAFAWSREQGDDEAVFTLATSLQPLWLARSRLREGWSWFDSIAEDITCDHTEVSQPTRSRALADKAILDGWMAGFGAEAQMVLARRALEIAREVGDPAVLARALTACGVNSYNAESADTYLPEALALARGSGDAWRLSQILGRQLIWAFLAGDAVAVSAWGREGLAAADSIGNPFESRMCRMFLAFAQVWQGDLASASAELGELIAEAEAERDQVLRVVAMVTQARTLAYGGDAAAARMLADAAASNAVALGPMYEGECHAVLTYAELAAGDVSAAAMQSKAALPLISGQPAVAAGFYAVIAQAALADGDLATASRLADDAVGMTTGWWRTEALIARARVAMAEGKMRQAEQDAHSAVACGAEVKGYLLISDALECLAVLAAEAGSHSEATRLLGTAHAMRRLTGEVRLKVHDAGVDAVLQELRDRLSTDEFDAAWAEGAALSPEDAIAYTQRGRGDRRRPASGWAALTPAERDVVQLAVEGLGNKDIGARLFVSPRTVQTHLTHVYAKLGIASRVQLMAEATRHG